MSTRLSLADIDRAHDEWGANCGPAAVAAITGMTLPDVRPFFEAHGFAAKRYTNPTMMFAILWDLEEFGILRDWRSNPLLPKDDQEFPEHGLARIQWHGRWMREGVPIRACYRHTHWVATIDAPHGRGIFDVNAVGAADGKCDGWTTAQAWQEIMVPHLTSGIPGADGAWSITHSIKIARLS